MFAPGENYQAFSLPVSSLNQLDATGADSSLDLKKIVSYGFCVYNNDDFGGVLHFYIDDLVVKAKSNPITTPSIQNQTKSTDPELSNKIADSNNSNQQTSSVMAKPSSNDDNVVNSVNAAASKVDDHDTSSDVKNSSPNEQKLIISNDVIIYVALGIFIILFACFTIWIRFK